MIPYNSIFIPLSAALGLSLTIERILEFGKNLLERIISRKKGRKIPTDAEFEKKIKNLEEIYQRDKLAREVEERAEELTKDRKKLKAKLESETNPAKRIKLKQELNALAMDGEWDEQFSNATVLVEPATNPDDGKILKTFILQLLGFAAGIIAVHYSGIQLFNCFLSALKQPTMPEWLDFLMTGLLIGGGSGPMHVLVRFVTQRKITVRKETASEVKEKATRSEKPSVPVVANPINNNDSDWVNIPYKGGVDREKLEWVHVRKKDPDLIIFHHTAMPSNSTFEDVVRVIKNYKDSRGNHWLTGYNCVVLADGSIHPFCRWDRFGNHAAGNNARSLGIAFNGNFETDPQVAGSNPDGRFGPWLPTENQLKSAARVVTLWTFLYNIKIDFENSIIPHNQVSNKPCPGSAFPYDDFKRWVEFFGERWEKSEAVKEHIEAFKLKPYLYMKKEV